MVKDLMEEDAGKQAGGCGGYRELRHQDQCHEDSNLQNAGEILSTYYNMGLFLCYGKSQGEEKNYPGMIMGKVRKSLSWLYLNYLGDLGEVPLPLGTSVFSSLEWGQESLLCFPHPANEGFKRENKTEKDLYIGKCFIHVTFHY